MAAVATTVGAPPRRAARRDPWEQVWWWSSAVALALVAVLAVTGVLLWSSYRPMSAQAWADLHPEVRIGLAERRVHQWASRLLVPATLVVAVSGVGARWRLRRWVPWPAAAFGVALVASFTGFLLPWDQLGLWAVTVGTDLSGMRALWSDHIRFVLIGGTEIGPATIRRWAVVHVVVGVALVATVVPRRARQR